MDMFSLGADCLEDLHMSYMLFMDTFQLSWRWVLCSFFLILFRRLEWNGFSSNGSGNVSLLAGFLFEAGLRRVSSNWSNLGQFHDVNAYLHARFFVAPLQLGI